MIITVTTLYSVICPFTTKLVFDLENINQIL